MSLRKLIKEAAAAVIKAENAQNSFRETFSFVYKRNVSSLPDDILAASRRAKYPTRKQPSSTSPPLSPPASAGDAASQQQTLKEGAKIATSWMFPWERRQMQGTGGLRTWEKAYWGVFVVAISLFLFNRLRDVNQQEEPQVDEKKEALKREKARMVLAGGSVVNFSNAGGEEEEEEDPFEGLSPEEVQRFVEETTGASAKDPFEGMSPEEINEYIRLQSGHTADQ